jgi:hypothetical protein
MSWLASLFGFATWAPATKPEPEPLVELKPCPKCGNTLPMTYGSIGRRRIAPPYSVRCAVKPYMPVALRGCGYSIEGFRTAEAAETAWNKQAAP